LLILSAVFCAAAGPAPAGDAAGAFSERRIAALHTHFLEQLYLSGTARLGRGDPAGAARLFALSLETASDLPQMNYSMALAYVLANFRQRQRALPFIGIARATDPRHPLYALLEVLANPGLSVLKPDGALYFTPAGEQQLADAIDRLAVMPDAPNGKYAAMVFAERTPTGDTALPQRLSGFAAMLGAGSHVLLPHVEQPQPLGCLLMLTVPSRDLGPYEPRLAQRLLAQPGAKYPG